MKTQKPGNPRNSGSQPEYSSPLSNFDEADLEYDEPEMNFFEKIKYGFLNLLGRGGPAYEEESEEEYPLDDCPHCGAPVKPKIRFCLNCQRQLVSPQKLTGLRTSQGVYAFPKSHKGGEGPSFSQKSKRKMAQTGLPLWQQAAIVAIIGYGVYAGMQNKAVMKQVNHMIASFSHHGR